MTLAIGAKLGPYEVLAPLGAGGMGEVWRAKDTRLDRDVAIKTLPAAVANDPERLARFEREAKLLAALNHPHIAAVHGFEHIHGQHLLIMEFVDGPTLADRLKSGPIPIDETLEIARQVAEALEAAHEKGIVHRDLKPANVKITPDGKVKVLDFGLARTADGSLSTTTSPGAPDLPTVTSPVLVHSPTIPGAIMGTAGYMSPEQARGKPVDKRSDIFSFGCLLYEMLAGAQPFGGETVTDSLGAILHREPDWANIPRDTPPTVQLLLRRCLTKERHKRLRDIGDARIDLENAIADPTSNGLLTNVLNASSRAKPWQRGMVIASVLIVAVGTLCAWAGWRLGRLRGDRHSSPVIRFAIDIPPPYKLYFGRDDEFSSIDISPNGSVLTLAVDKEPGRALFVREMSSTEFRELAGTEGAYDPFFSPDGRWIAFSSDGKLKKVPLAGGPPITLGDAPWTQGDWLDDGSMVMSTRGGRSLVRISDTGGSPSELAAAGITKRTSGGERLLLGFSGVCAVPGADYVLAGIWDGDTIEDYAIVKVSLTDGNVRPLVQNAARPIFVAPGRLLFLRGSSILSVPFDPRRGEVTGEAIQVIDGVLICKWADPGWFSASLNGTLVYVPGGRPGPGRRLIRVDAAGKAEPLMPGTDAIVGGLRVSPDGGSLTVTTMRRKMELWNFNMGQRSFALINNIGESWQPVWTPDGRHVLFRNILPGKYRALVRKRADGSGAIEHLSQVGEELVHASSFSPDGRLLLCDFKTSIDRPGDIVVHRMDKMDAPEILLGSSADESEPRFAPDGKHFAYCSDETGPHEVYVRTYPDSGARWQISQGGGRTPTWSHDGKRLYFLDRGDAMRMVEADLTGAAKFSAPQKLFDTRNIATTNLWGDYDVLPDGSFVMVESAEWERKPPRIQVVINWPAEVEK